MHLLSFWDLLRLLSCLLPETEELPPRMECFNSGEFAVKQHPIVLVQGLCAHLFSTCRAAVRLWTAVMVMKAVNAEGPG